MVRNNCRQQANVLNDIFLKLNDIDIETRYEKTTIYKNNEQTKLTDYFLLNY